MTEETQATDSGADVVTETTETLDDVISQYNVQAPPAQAQSSQQPQYTPPQVKVDPLDENQFSQWSQSVVSGQSALDSQLREMKEKLTQFEQKESELRIETEINDAITEINDGLNLPKKNVRVFLELTAQEKPAFKRVWDNRHNDPQTYKRAIKAIKKELADTFVIKQDSELTETQSAIQQSQKSLASQSGKQKTGSIEERMAEAKSQSEFDRLWDSMRQ